MRKYTEAMNTLYDECLRVYYAFKESGDTEAWYNATQRYDSMLIGIIQIAIYDTDLSIDEYEQIANYRKACLRRLYEETKALEYK